MVQKEKVQAAGLIIRSTALFKFHACTALYFTKLHAYVQPSDGTKENCGIVVSEHRSLHPSKTSIRLLNFV
jgi:hypothetical protein